MVLRKLADERRRVAADWRILLLARRTMLEVAERLVDEDRAGRLLSHMHAVGDVENIEGVEGVYAVSTPFASTLPLTPEAIVQEADPWAAISHLSAMAHHGLTDELPVFHTVTHFKKSFDRLPLGTTAEEWVGLERARVRRPHRVLETEVLWTQSDGKYDFGVCIDISQGMPSYVTDVERTLVDAIRAPAKSGGIVTVLRAWKRSARRVRTDKLVEYTDRFGSGVMRQRVGFLMESVGLIHPQLAAWRGKSIRGGSMKLVADAPFEGRYSEQWCLSINVPENEVRELQDSNEIAT